MGVPETAQLTVPAKHVFLDVVEFTRDRSVEAQVDIVRYLNEIVLSALEVLKIAEEKRILLPTGDGMCLVLLEIFDPYDIHLLLALTILESLAAHNERTEDSQRRFSLRIGINENVDNLVRDVNGRRNIAGSGINMAQRVMTLADPNQILVSHTVHEMLRQRERYLKSFRPLTSTIKHEIRITAYQYLSASPGLNSEPPIAFRPAPAKRRRMPPIVAHYISLADLHRDAIVESDDDFAPIVLLWFLAEDALRRDETPSYQKPASHAPKGASFQEQLAIVDKGMSYVVSGLASYIRDVELEDFPECFDRDTYGLTDYRFASDVGLQTVLDQHPTVAAQYASLGTKDDDHVGPNRSGNLPDALE